LKDQLNTKKYHKKIRKIEKFHLLITLEIE